MEWLRSESRLVGMHVGAVIVSNLWYILTLSPWLLRMTIHLDTLPMAPAYDKDRLVVSQCQSVVNRGARKVTLFQPFRGHRILAKKVHLDMLKPVLLLLGSGHIGGSDTQANLFCFVFLILKKPETALFTCPEFFAFVYMNDQGCPKIIERRTQSVR